MSTKDQLKEYIKQELVASSAFPTDDAGQLDKVANAFAVAIDKYLKDDVKVAVGIQSTVNVTAGTGITITQGILV